MTPDELWERYKTDPSVRDEIILHYMPLVHYAAKDVASTLPNTFDREDLESYGVFGLIDAIDKFDPDLGNKFQTYAISRIRGAIMDELRSEDWVPRSIRSKAREIAKVTDLLVTALGRQPTPEETAEHLGWSLDEYYKVRRQVDRTHLASFEGPTFGAEDDEQPMEQHFGGQLSVEDLPPEIAELQERLGRIMDNLDGREKAVLTLSYFLGYTLAEIGTFLGVTESRVSQIHSKALMQVRAKLVEAS